MDSKDWQDLARVYRVGAASYYKHGVPTSGSLHAEALTDQADMCETVAAERRAAERAAHHQAVKGGLS